MPSFLPGIIPAANLAPPMPALETLSYAVEVWSDDGNHLIEILARVSNFEIATAAYWAALRVRPKDYLILRQGAMVIRERRAVRQRPTPQ